MTQTITSTRTTALVRTQPAAPAPVPTASEMGDLVAYAQMIASARDALPPTYQKNPGAIALVVRWADAHGVDLLSAMQNVAFYQGRPLVDASMQRALAERSGLKVIVSTDPGKSATVRLVDADGQLRGEETYTIEEARKAGLFERPKSLWPKYTMEMLVAAATRRVIRWHAPSVLLGVFDRDEIDDDGRISVELTRPPEFEQTDPDEIIEPEVVEEAEPEVVEEAEPEPTPPPTARTNVVPIERPRREAAEPVPAAEAPAETVPEDDAKPADKMTRAEFSTACRAHGCKDTVALRFARDLDPEDPPLNVTAVVDRGRTFCEQVLDAIPRNDGPEQH